MEQPGPGPAGDGRRAHPEEQQQEQEQAPREGPAAPPPPAQGPQPAPAPPPAPASLGEQGQQPGRSSAGSAEHGAHGTAPGGHWRPAPASAAGPWDSPGNPGGPLPLEMDPLLTDDDLANIPLDCEKYLEDIADDELGKLSESEEFFRISMTDFLLTISTKKRPGLLRPSRNRWLELLHEMETSQEVQYNNLVPPQHGHLLDFTAPVSPAGPSATEPFSGGSAPRQERPESGCSTSGASAQAENAAPAQAMVDANRAQPDLGEAAGSTYEREPRAKRKRSLTAAASPATPAGQSQQEGSLPARKRHRSC